MKYMSYYINIKKENKVLQKRNTRWYSREIIFFACPDLFDYRRYWTLFQRSSLAAVKVLWRASVNPSLRGKDCRGNRCFSRRCSRRPPRHARRRHPSPWRRGRHKRGAFLGAGNLSVIRSTRRTFGIFENVSTLYANIIRSDGTVALIDFCRQFRNPWRIGCSGVWQEELASVLCPS